MNEVAVPNATPAPAPGASRTLTITVLRYNPQEPGSVPHLQTYDWRKPTA